MCECCNANDLDMKAALDALRNYRGMPATEMVPKADVYERFSQIYNNGEMAAFAVNRIERDAGCAGILLVPAKAVASELEILLLCHGNTKTLLDG